MLIACITSGISLNILSAKQQTKDTVNADWMFQIANIISFAIGQKTRYKITQPFQWSFALFMIVYCHL